MTLTSYDTAVNDQRLLSKVAWDLLILDEAQRIKNPEAGRTLAIKTLPRRGTICITGTPVENSLVDLWSVTDGALPGLLGDVDDFAARFPDEFESAKALGEITVALTVRRSVEEVGVDLPPRVESVVPVEAPDEIMAVHRSIEAAESGLVATTACRVLMANAGNADWDLATSPKGEILLTKLEAAFGRKEKVLVFASFQRSLDRLGEMIAVAHPGVWARVIDGRRPAQQRQALIDEFSAVNGGAVLLMNPQATGVGLNVVAANHVIHFNPEWNPALTAQATARAHRRRQERTVFVYHLYYVDTVEERALARSSFKEQLAGQVAKAAQNPEEDHV